MPYHKFVLNFNAGELSPFLAARTDLAKYESGCQTMENFIILPYGGVVRRPGTQYLGAAKFGDKRCRVIGFNFSTTTNFVLEFGDQYLRFWTEAVQVQFPQGSPTRLPHGSPTPATGREAMCCKPPSVTAACWPINPAPSRQTFPLAMGGRASDDDPAGLGDRARLCG